MMKLVDSVLASIGMNPIKSGEIIAKKHYPPTSIQTSGFTVNGSPVTTTQTVETFSVIVKGRGKFGTSVTEEEIIDADTWANVNVGDRWPIRFAMSKSA